MRYLVLIFLDEHESPISFLYLDTNVGRVVILFRDQDKLAVVAGYAIEHILKPGHKMGVVELEFSSTEEAAHLFGEDDPLLRDATFLPDSDPFVTELVASLRKGDPNGPPKSTLLSELPACRRSVAEGFVAFVVSVR